MLVDARLLVFWLASSPCPGTDPRLTPTSAKGHRAPPPLANATPTPHPVELAVGQFIIEERRKALEPGGLLLIGCSKLVALTQCLYCG